MPTGFDSEALPAPPRITQGRPAVLGRQHMVSSSHYLASLAGLRMFPRGGNAIDAGIAAGIALNVLERDLTDLGGVAPVMVLTAGMERPVTIDGLGRAPAGATLRRYRERYGGGMPPGIARACVPAAVDSWLTALARFGRLTLAEVLTPAIELADGFPVHPRLARAIERVAQQLRDWPASAATFLPKGRAPSVGEPLVQRDLGLLLRRLVVIEHAHAQRGRSAAILAAREAFYRGDIARQIAEFVRRADGLLDYDDLASYAVTLEPAIHTTYRGYDVYACGPWSQGPVVPMTLNILEQVELSSFPHNGADHLHTLAEAVKLAFADREAYIGDPDMVDVPLRGMLSKDYAARQYARIDGARASDGLPTCGDPWSYEGRRGAAPSPPQPVAGPVEADTSYVCAVDHDGNAFSATPSDPGLSGPLVPGLGIIVSTRGSQFWLEEGHPSAIAPRKRPRLTPNPAMLMRGGKVFMPFGCPGGDAQTQAMVQVACNVIDFGMNVQAAIEAPRVISWSFPNSFWPHAYEPGLLSVEGRIVAPVRDDLRARGHRVQEWPEWTPAAAGVCAITVDDRGTMAGGADPRRESYAVGW
jgi:gamma-glutamyltranspeptidase/glutathione hydrolase